MFYLIGLGLGDEKDITIKGYEAIQRCTKVYLESYTSVLGFMSVCHPPSGDQEGPEQEENEGLANESEGCLLYTSPSPRD